MTSTARIVERRLELARDRADAAARSLADDPTTTAQLAAETALDDLERYSRLLPLLAPEERARRSPYLAGQASFLADLAAAADGQGGDVLDRLRRHREATADLETRATTGNYGALVVPAYLTDKLAGAPRPARRLADLLAEPLPSEGASVTLPAIDTPAAGNVQSAENTAPAIVTPSSEPVSVPIRTAHAALETSLQMIQRGETGFEALWTRELLGALDAEVERLLLNGSGASGEPTGILTAAAGAVTYTDGTPDAAGFLDAIAEAVAVSTAARGLTPDLIAIHPRRLAWLQSRNEAGVAAALGGPRPGAPAAVAAGLLGLDVVSSAAVPTDLGAAEDQDAVLVMRRADIYFGEAPPAIALVRDDSGANALRCRFRVTQYVAVDASRFADAVVVVGGTGLADPWAA